MPEVDFIKQVMEYGALWAFAIFVCFVFWKKVLPLGDRYMSSVEKLHDSIGEKMTAQTLVQQSHENALKVHDEGMRNAAQEACDFCRKFVAKEFTNSINEANEAFAKIERIIGEA